MELLVSKTVRLHFTNVNGLGATRLLQSLLPFLLDNHYRISQVYCPSVGELSSFNILQKNTLITPFKRYLPNSLSRFLECTTLGYQFNGNEPLLVFGDIPIKCKARQTVFFQNTLLLKGERTGRKLGALKYWIARWVFQRNIKYASSFIVQTETVKSSLIASYPETKGLVYVVSQPPPSWLINANFERKIFKYNTAKGLRLFYPADFYPHKNHKILGGLNKALDWPISELILTIPNDVNPNKSLSCIKCVGKLQPEAVVDIYRSIDSLLFLSLSESYGLPLVEAMWIGLPIICPDLPYARILCGNQAIYFDPYDVESLHVAIIRLSQLKQEGWWPDWKEQLKSIPKNWQQVASSMLDITLN